MTENYYRGIFNPKTAPDWGGKLGDLWGTPIVFSGFGAKPFVPKVGDKVSLPSWDKDTFLTVEWTNDRYVAGVMNNGEKRSYDARDARFAAWVKPEPPKPKTKDVTLTFKWRKPVPGDLVWSDVCGQPYLAQPPDCRRERWVVETEDGQWFVV